MFNPDRRFLETKKNFSNDVEYINMIKTFDYFQGFYDKLFYDVNNLFVLLTKYDDNLTPIKSTPIFLRLYMRNISNTIYSSKKCFEVMNVSDGFALLRKLKDNLFFIKLVLQIKKIDTQFYDNKEKIKNYNGIVDKVFLWTENNMNNLSNKNIKTILNYDNTIKKLDEENGYFDKLEELTSVLNNFTHTNGYRYLDSQDPLIDKKKSLQVMNEITDTLTEIVARSFVLMFYISEELFRRIDYIDYLEAGGNSPEFLEERSKEVDTFFNIYITERLSITHPKFVDFIRENTNMTFF